RLAGAVTGLAVLLEDARHLFGVGDVGARVAFRGAVDQAAVGLGFGEADLAAGEDVVDGLGEVGARRLLPALAGAVLVVDAAAVTQRQLAVEDGDGGDAADADLLGELLAGVLEGGERQ